MSSSPRVRRPLSSQSRIARVGVGLCGLLVAGSLAPAPAATAAEPVTTAWVEMGTAENYSVLAGAGVANTGDGTVLAKDLGLSPAGVIAGFPPGKVNGATHDKDGVAAAAQEDSAAAYEDAATRESTTTFAGDQGGKTFGPGVHSTVAAFTNTGTITLDAAGDSSAVFVFQVGAAFSSAASTKVALKNGALANNVFWQVVGAISIGAGATFVGTFLAAGAVTLGAGASLKGRILTPGTIALTNSPVTEPKDDLVAPVVTIDGGATGTTHDLTPPISGTTDEPAGRAVSVAVAGQTLTTTVRTGGAWSVSASALTEGPHDVVVTIADASQNVGTATQVLTVDTTPPAVDIDGASSRATNDLTPTLTGTTDVPVGTPVQVTVAGQVLAATVDAAGAWSADAGTLTESAHLVTATVSDGAGNQGVAHQVLDVDVTLPVIAIDGGATATTSDTSPWTYGTTGEQAGTLVSLTVGGQDLEATVRTGGGWSVSATTLAPGTYPVVASITDAAQNTSVARQTLTIGTTPPVEEPPVEEPPVEEPPVQPPVQPQPTFRPDAAIRGTKGAFVGTGRYAPADQKVTQTVRRGGSKAFQVRLTNRGDAADRMTVRGSARSKQFRVSYRVGGRDVTAAVVAGRYLSPNLSPAGSVVVAVTVTRTPAARAGHARRFEVRATSTRAAGVRDVVGAVARA